MTSQSSITASGSSGIALKSAPDVVGLLVRAERVRGAERVFVPQVRALASAFSSGITSMPSAIFWKCRICPQTVSSALSEASAGGVRHR
jgi:hypothetical protein